VFAPTESSGFYLICLLSCSTFVRASPGEIRSQSDLNNMQSGNTYQLVRDVTVDSRVSLPGNITLYGNSYYIESSVSPVFGTMDGTIFNDLWVRMLGSNQASSPLASEMTGVRGQGLKVQNARMHNPNGDVSGLSPIITNSVLDGVHIHGRFFAGNGAAGGRGADGEFERRGQSLEKSGSNGLNGAPGYSAYGLTGRCENSQFNNVWLNANLNAGAGGRGGAGGHGARGGDGIDGTPGRHQTFFTWGRPATDGTNGAPGVPGGNGGHGGHGGHGGSVALISREASECSVNSLIFTGMLAAGTGGVGGNAGRGGNGGDGGDAGRAGRGFPIFGRSGNDAARGRGGYGGHAGQPGAGGDAGQNVVGFRGENKMIQNLLADGQKQEALPGSRGSTAANGQNGNSGSGLWKTATDRRLPPRPAKPLPPVPPPLAKGATARLLDNSLYFNQTIPADARFGENDAWYDAEGKMPVPKGAGSVYSSAVGDASTLSKNTLDCDRFFCPCWFPPGEYSGFASQLLPKPAGEGAYKVIVTTSEPRPRSYRLTWSDGSFSSGNSECGVHQFPELDPYGPNIIKASVNDNGYCYAYTSPENDQFIRVVMTDKDDNVLLAFSFDFDKGETVSDLKCTSDRISLLTNKALGVIGQDYVYQLPVPEWQVNDYKQLQVGPGNLFTIFGNNPSSIVLFNGTFLEGTVSFGTETVPKENLEADDILEVMVFESRTFFLTRSDSQVCIYAFQTDDSGRFRQDAAFNPVCLPGEGSETPETTMFIDTHGITLARENEGQIYWKFYDLYGNALDESIIQLPYGVELQGIKLTRPSEMAEDDQSESHKKHQLFIYAQRDKKPYVQKYEHLLSVSSASATTSGPTETYAVTPGLSTVSEEFQTAHSAVVTTGSVATDPMDVSPSLTRSAVTSSTGAVLPTVAPPSGP
jgi:hypothetical protein